MKLVHTSDLHLGIYLFSLSLLPFQQKLARVITDCAESENADCIIISGDIYNTKDPSGESVKAFDSFIKELFSAERHIPVIIISGNHDYAPRLSVHSSLLESCGLHIRGTLSDYLRPVEIGDAQIYCLPFFTVSEVKAIADAENSEDEIKIESQTDAFRYLTDRIKENWDNSKKHIIAAHCFAVGGITSDSEKATKSALSARFAGGAQLTDASLFADFDYAALGHLHSAQTIDSGGKAVVRYSGTPLPYSFSEGNEYSNGFPPKIREKSLSVFDTDTRVLKAVPVENILSLKTVSGSLEEITAMAADTRENEYVRLIFTDRATAAGLSDTISSLYPNKLVADCRPQSLGGARDSVTAEQVKGMSAEELAERFITVYHKREFTDEMRKWISDAVTANERDDR